MRKNHGIVAAVPIGALLLLAAVGCSSTVAAAPATPTNPVTTAVSTAGGVSTSTATSAAPTQAVTATATTASSVAPTQAPFPGIWDITTWAQYRTAQAAVLQGHQPWLLDPALVVAAWAADWHPTPAVHKVSANVFTVVKPGTNVTYTIRGVCPEPKSSAPIWVITSITHD